MKRGKLSILLIFLLILPVVSATISIEGPTRSEYNIGDSIEIYGYVWSEEAVDGFLSTTVICGKKKHKLQLVPIELQEQQQLSFPEEVSLPEISVSAAMSGKCKVEVALMEGLTKVESSKSAEFKVVKGLEGTFDMVNTEIQVGEDLEITGQITQKDGDLVDGLAEVYYTYNRSRYLIEVVNVRDGEFMFTQKTKATPAGTYKVDVEVRDTYGNEEVFKKVATFLLVRELTVITDTNKYSYLPGDTMKVTGDVTNLYNIKIPEAKVEITLNGKEVDGDVVDGSFEQEFTIPNDMKSGENVVSILVKDPLGNTGGEQLTIEVMPVATKIDNEIDVRQVNPGEDIKLTPWVYDQAGDMIDDDVLVEIYDAKDNLRLSKRVKSNQRIILKIPMHAIPGDWKLKTSINDISAENDIEVLEMMALDVDMDGEIIYVTNVGNMKYKDGLQVEAKSELDEFEIKKRKSLKPNETIVINLNKELPSGTYDVTVPLPNTKPKVIENVVISEGKPQRSLNGLYLALIILFIILVLYFALSKVKLPSRKKKHHVHKPVRKKKRLVNVRKAGEEHAKAERKKRSDMKDFKDRILEEIKKTEDKAEDVLKSKKGEWFGTHEEAPKEEPKKNKPKEGGSAFANMFG